MLRVAVARRVVCTARRSARAASTVADAAAVDAYRRWGHAGAALDPLGLATRTPRPELAAVAGGDADPALLARLEAAYCGAIGAEFEHVDAAEERLWWAHQLETRVPTDGPGAFTLSPAAKKNAAMQMLQADTFENFLGRKYASLKRYSGEGTEALLPALDTVFAAAAAGGVGDAVIGMAHRGRLALLVTLLGFPARKLFHKIHGYDGFPAQVQGLDDVTSHLAASMDKAYAGRKIHVSLLHNPSHLEAVNPVAAGKVRAKQDQGSRHALCIQVHGDAAVYGQGVVAETYAMSRLPGYTVGGTVHIITNNQVGFTADCSVSRSSAYASDTAKMVGSPILHVNAERVREVVLAAQLAVEYRNRFGKDVVLDLIGYRRYGHNEVDEPSFTQPHMYGAIRPRAPFAVSYARQLEGEGLLAVGQVKVVTDKLNAHLEAELAASKAYTATGGCMDVADPNVPGRHVVGDGTAFAGKWSAMRQATNEDMATSPDTGMPVAHLKQLGRASVTVPDGFSVHPRLTRGHIVPRLKEMEAGDDAGAVDWATAEALAMASVLDAGHDVRMSGQDVQRGTFSHRHASLTDQATGRHHIPLNHIRPDQHGKLQIYSSLLSEEAVLGFEYGYSWENPDTMVLWEAQFGDFVNGAQIMVDQFLSGGETKWLRQSGLIMLLPHGFDGAGPEHSSAHMERFLQLVNSQAWGRGALCVDPEVAAKRGHHDKTMTEAVNFIVANPSTPANYFHLLRRQMVRPFRKPLVVIAPKTLLRLPEAVSTWSAFAPGTRFQPILPDPSAPAQAVTRVLLTSGKLYYDLVQRRAAAKDTTTAVVRVEELAPFPTHAITRALAGMPGLKEVVWVQEEPANAGAWTWAEAHLTPAFTAAKLPALQYVGRPALPAAAVGLSKANKKQEDYFMTWLW